MVRFDTGLKREARQLTDEMFVVNGMDGSEVTLDLVENLRAGSVDATIAGGLRGGVRPLVSPGSPHLQFVRSHPDRVVQATSVADLERARREDTPALIFNWQRADYLGPDPARLSGFHAMGLRSTGLVYNVGNHVGSGCVDPDQGRLSHLGEEIVEAILEHRIVLDVGGHASEATSMDALRRADGPVVSTHTNPRALRDNPRGISDEMFRAVADTGGVIGICSFNYFLVENGRATLDDYLDHVDYAVDLVGARHVGLGLDFILGRQISGRADPRRFPPDAYPQRYEQWTVYPDGISSFADVPNITAGLMERGYAHADIERIMGRNWLRVWREVWGE